MTPDSPNLPAATSARGMRVVLLEDNPADAALLQAELDRQGLLLPVTVVSTRQEFALAVEMLHPDLVLADHSLPDMDAWEALHLVQRVAPGVPFVLVTGTLPAERANAFVRAGATDYVLKDHLARLGPLIRRLRETKAREAAWRATDTARRAGEAHLRAWGRVYGPLLTVFDDCRDIVGMTRRDGRVEYLNPMGRLFLGLDLQAELPALTLAELQPAWALALLDREGFAEAARLGSWRGLTAIQRRTGEEVAARQTLLAYAGETGEARAFTFLLRLLPSQRTAADDGAGAA